MDRSLIERLAREAGMCDPVEVDGTIYGDTMDVRKFAALVAEEAAKLCDVLGQMHDGEECAAAIRARFKEAL